MMMTKLALRRLLCDEAGASAAEFALILPVLIVMTLGVINAGFMIYSYTTLNFAAADAARCRAVNTTVCTDDTSTATYALGAYVGFTPAPTFTRTTDGCGNTVQGTATFSFSTGLTTTPITMQASACYPLQT